MWSTTHKGARDFEPQNSDRNNIQITHGRRTPPLLSQGKVAVMVRKNAPTLWISRRSEWSWKLVVNGQQEVSGVLVAKSDVRICANVDDGCHEMVQHFCQSLPCSAKNIFRTNFALKRGLTEQEQMCQVAAAGTKIKKQRGQFTTNQIGTARETKIKYQTSCSTCGCHVPGAKQNKTTPNTKTCFEAEGRT